MTLLAPAAIVVALLAAFTILFFRLASRFDSKAISPAWLEEFSLESYAPMERLLDASDFRFLEAQAVYRPEVGKRLLSERRGIFREYLGMLIGDFNRLHFLARSILVHSSEERPGLARELFRQQVRFYFAVCLLRCKVAFYPLGWTAVDVPKLLHALENMRGQIALGALPQAADAV